MLSVKKKVLIIDNSIDYTGAFKAILQVTDGLRNEFEFVYLISKKSKLQKLLSQKDYKVYTLPFLEINKSIKNFFFYFPNLVINGYGIKNLIKKEDVGMVHVNDFYNLSAVVAKMLGAKFDLVTHVRFMPQRFPKTLSNIWKIINLTYAKHIVCVSYAVRNFFPDNSRIRVIYDGIEEEFGKTYPKSSSAELIHILYLANYIRGKGQEVALEAFSKAFKVNNKLRLKFVGGDMGLSKNALFKQELIQKVYKMNLEDVVFFEGKTSNIEEKFNSADIFLNFSESESYSFTCLEALACGVPLIASDSGGPKELFQHYESGILVENGNIAEMTNAILMVSSDKKLREKLSLNGKINIKKKFPLKNTLLQIKQMYLT